MSKWKIVNQGIMGNTILNANTYNLEGDIKKAKTISVWMDWNGNYNAYYSRYPFDKDYKLYSGKSREKALIAAKKYMRSH